MQPKKQKYKKRPGSSLVVVLMIFTVLFILSTSIMGTLTMAVKVQNSEKNQVETLYQAESGIATVQVALEKTFETAMNIAQSTATSNETFQQAVEAFIGITDDNKFAQSAETLSYWHNETETTPLPSLTNEITVDESIYNQAEKRWEMVVQSAFTDVTQTNRTVQVNVKIQLPDWSPAPEIEEEINPDLDAPLLPLFERNVLTIGGNLYVENANVDLQGNVFVQGRSDEELSGLDAKYAGGIYNHQPDGGNFVMSTGTIVTGETLHINGNNTTTKIASNNFYGKNILVEDQANLIIDQSAILDSDLVITAKKGTTKITNFYGINDVMVDKPSLIRDSSSIIINAPVTTEATLSIPNQAMIAGTAWIDLDRPYQTGESLAIQGNYLAYTIPVSELQSVCSDFSNAGIGKCSELVYEYYEPLQVITGIKNLNSVKEWSVAEKAKYFKIIAEKLNQNQQYIKFNPNFNVIAANTTAAGALLYMENGELKVKLPDSQTSQKITDMQKQKQPEYAKQVYRLGYDDVGTTAELQAIYDQYGADTWRIENILDFTKGEPIQVENKDTWDEQANDSLIYNPDPEKTVYVVGKTEACPSVDTNGKEVICMQLKQYKNRLI
ncbi:MAG: pilus assembly PilX N-terminal domain-containing protein, partial [Culicoidibacterales bacterium]